VSLREFQIAGAWPILHFVRLQATKVGVSSAGECLRLLPRSHAPIQAGPPEAQDAGRGKLATIRVGGTVARKRDKVFVSYSHADARWLTRLQLHLRPLEREGSLDLWDDTRIPPGAEWREEISDSIASAKVVVLLVSASFLASEFIANDELPRLLAAAESRGAVIMPLIVSPSAFERTPSLSRFQAINPPSSPLVDMRRGAQEKVFEKLAQAIEDAFRSRTIAFSAHSEATEAQTAERQAERKEERAEGKATEASKRKARDIASQQNIEARQQTDRQQFQGQAEDAADGTARQASLAREYLGKVKQRLVDAEFVCSQNMSAGGYILDLVAEDMRLVRGSRKYVFSVFPSLDFETFRDFVTTTRRHRASWGWRVVELGDFLLFSVAVVQELDPRVADAIRSSRLPTGGSIFQISVAVDLPSGRLYCPEKNPPMVTANNSRYKSAREQVLSMIRA
jgi:hypothetical protein